MKPVVLASSATDYLSKKKGLVVNNSDITKTILANVEAAEHKAVVVPFGTPVGYVLTVTDQLRSDWAPSNLILNKNNEWTHTNNFLIPPTINYSYTVNENSNRIATTRFVRNVTTGLGLSSLLTNGSTSSSGQFMTFLNTGSTSTLQSTELSFHSPTTSTQYTRNGITSTQGITISSTSLTLDAGTSVMQSMYFVVPPSVPDPSLGRDAANKSYVDTLVGNYSGSGVNLYLNAGETNTLSNQLINTSGTEITTPSTQTEAFITFVSDVMNLSVILPGIWAMTLYGYVSEDTGMVQYHFKLYRRTQDDTDILIDQSVDSSDMNGLNPAKPDTYQSYLSIRTAYTEVLPTDRLVIKLFVTSSNSNNSVLHTFFGGSYYSFVTTSLSGGTSILSMNNIFTGTNQFDSVTVTDSLQSVTEDVSTSNTQVATTQFVHNALGSTYFTTQDITDSSTQVATTEYVKQLMGSTLFTTQGDNDNQEHIATTRYVQNMMNSNYFQTRPDNDNTTYVASTAFVKKTVDTAISNIYFDSNVLLSGQTIYTGLLGVTGTATVGGLLTAGGITTSTLGVTSVSFFEKLLTASGGITGSTITASTLGVTNTSSFGGLLTAIGGITTNVLGVSSASFFNGLLTANGITASTLGVTSTSSFGGLLTANGITCTTITSSTSLFNGLLTASGGITGTTIAIGNLGVTNAATIGGLLTANGVSASTVTATTQLTANQIQLPTTSMKEGTSFSVTASLPIEITSSEININGQATFDTPPHGTTPMFANDLATKGYVDTLVGNYGGNGLQLYFNLTNGSNTLTAPVLGDLETNLIEISTAPYYYTVTKELSSLTTKIATFNTATGDLNLNIIPTGLWNMLVYGSSSSMEGDLYYYFEVNEIDINDSEVATIVTSGNSNDVNAATTTEPTAYHCSGSLVTPYTMTDSSNRLQIVIYARYSGVATPTLSTLFGGAYYSFMTSSLSGGTSILTTNNTWSGYNTFALDTFTQTLVAPAINSTASLYTTNTALIVVGSSGTTTQVSGINIYDNTVTTLTSSTNLSIGSNQVTGTLNLGTNNDRSSMINIGADGCTVSLRGKVTCSSTLYTQIITAPVLSSDASLYENITGNIKIGQTGTTTQIAGLSIWNGSIEHIYPFGPISIGSEQVDGELYMGTNASRTGRILIGSSGCTTTLSGDITCSNRILTSTINGTTNTSTVSLYTSNTAPILIGSSGTTTQVSGISIYGSTINAITNTSTVSLYTSNNAPILIGSSGTTAQVSGISIYGSTINSTGGTVDLWIGAGQTSGVLNIGTNSARTGIINLGTNKCPINAGGTFTNGITLPGLYFISPPSDIYSVGYSTTLITSTSTSTWGGNAFGYPTAAVANSTQAGGITGVWLYEFAFQPAVTAIQIKISLTGNTTMDPLTTQSFVPTTVYDNNKFRYVCTKRLITSTGASIHFTTSSGTTVVNQYLQVTRLA